MIRGARFTPPRSLPSLAMTEILRLPRPVHLRFVWLLPLWFAAGSLIGSTVAGHNGQLYFIGALAELWLWILAVLLSSGLAGYVLLQGHGDIEAAIAHHGSLLAYLICALQLGGYAATLIVLAVQAGRGGRGYA